MSRCVAVLTSSWFFPCCIDIVSLTVGLPAGLNEEVEFAQNELTQHKGHLQSAQNTRLATHVN